MTIETKFNPKNVVWFIKDEKVLSQDITSIDISVVKGNDVRIFYLFFRPKGESFSIKENKVFPTKEALLQSL